MEAWLILLSPVKQERHIPVTQEITKVSERQNIQDEVPWTAKIPETKAIWPGCSWQMAGGQTSSHPPYVSVKFQFLRAVKCQSCALNWQDSCSHSKSHQ